MTTTTSARIDLRIDAEIKLKAERASALLGKKSLTEYVVSVLDEDATRVIEEHQTIKVSEDVYDQFITACEKAEEPNEALKEAFSLAREKGFINDKQ